MPGYTHSMAIPTFQTRTHTNTHTHTTNNKHARTCAAVDVAMAMDTMEMDVVMPGIDNVTQMPESPRPERRLGTADTDTAPFNSATGRDFSDGNDHGAYAVTRVPFSPLCYWIVFGFVLFLSWRTSGVTCCFCGVDAITRRFYNLNLVEGTGDTCIICALLISLPCPSPSACCPPRL